MKPGDCVPDPDINFTFYLVLCCVALSACVMGPTAQINRGYATRSDTGAEGGKGKYTFSFTPVGGDK